MCSYRRSPLSPSLIRTETEDSSCYGSQKDWRLAYGTLSEGPLRDQRHAARNTILIGPTMATTILRRCSSSDEDDAEEDERMGLSVGTEEEEGDQSRTDASEDSVEVRVLPITANPISQCSHLQKNKRKLAEPRKLAEGCKPSSMNDHNISRHRLSRPRHCSRLPRTLDTTPPPKKHCPPSHLHHPRDAHISAAALCPFRPWSSETLRHHGMTTPTPASPSDGSSYVGTPFVRPELRGGDPSSTNQEEPLSLVLNADRSFAMGRGIDIPKVKTREERWGGSEAPFSRDRSRPIQNGALPATATSPETVSRTEEVGEVCDTDVEDEAEEEEGEGVERVVRLDTPMASNVASGSSASSQHSVGVGGGSVMAGGSGKDVGDQKSHLRNYKNMTRERRMEANARERTRVHTISAAFDTLRRAVPAYAHNQRLSKLSVLRIACAYIVTLSRVAGKDYSASSDSPSLSECVDKVTRTIQTEGKVRRRRDE